MNLYWLDGITQINRSEIGGKAATLAGLQSRGFPVPPGFVIPASVMRDVFDENRLSAQLINLDIADNEGLTRRLRLINKAIAAVRWPAAIRQAIAEAYETLGGRVAVRSSGIVEDSVISSFAGAYDTFLDRSSIEEILEAVLACWASAFSPKVAAYRLAHGLQRPTWLMGVVVQRMVIADKSGVMFTVNPSGDDKTVLIEAVAGGCEKIVAGQPYEQSVEFDRASNAIVTNKQVAHAKQRFGSGASAFLQGGAIRAPRLLRKSDIITLVDTGLRIEAYLEAAADVEWAITGGKLAVLQARPITSKCQGSAVP